MFALSSANESHGVNRFRSLLLAAAVITFLLIVAGKVVRATNSGLACPDWPTCFGQVGVPASVEAQVQVVHRVLAALAMLAISAAAAWAWRSYRAWPWIIRPLFAAVGVMMVEILLGAAAIWSRTPLLFSPVHFAMAMLALGMVLVATVVAFTRSAHEPRPSPLRFHSPFARLTLWTTAAVFVLMLSGTLVASLDAGKACAAWPLCGGAPLSWQAGLALAHRGFTLAAGLLAGWQFVLAWRSQRSQLVALPAATGVFLLTLAQVMLGALKVQRGFPADLIGLHAASSAALWGIQVVAVAAAGLAARTAQDEIAEASEPLPLMRRFKDFIILSKPVIVLLLLVTTYAGMVVGLRRIPGAGVTFWTMLGGALAAGGASALNQFIDRETDKAMQRTEKRPLPDGRLKPAEGLAYGLGACLAAFFLLAGFVNLFSAVLSLAGMIYYVLLYSVWLKHLTVQNIVIGGGAGAIPPLVGWAAATGRLDIPALFLFAIVFFWTPPHFWALALVRRNDYARGKVPMLPVIRGEEETRKQVFIYTLELVALTLLMPLFKMAGSVYFVSAALLGAWLIFTAWRVLKKGGNKTAYTMYRASSMYLMFLFIALVIDVFI